MHDQSEGPIILAAFANDHRDAANFLRNLSEEAQRMQAALEPARGRATGFVVWGYAVALDFGVRGLV